jgi:hypothetical protein
MRKIFYFTNIILLILISILLFFSTILYLGTKEKLDYKLTHNYWELFIGRFVLNEIVIIFATIFLIICNLFFRKAIIYQQRKKILLLEFCFLTTLSIIFILINYRIR